MEKKVPEKNYLIFFQEKNGQTVIKSKLTWKWQMKFLSVFSSDLVNVVYLTLWGLSDSIRLYTLDYLLY